MADDVVELLVIGGGVSGLGFAHFARQRGVKTLLLEAADQFGGCIHTHQFKTSAGPYWAELGAHTCYNSYGNLLQILQDTGQLDSLQAKQSLKFWLQTQAGLRSILSELNFWELLGVIPRLLRAKKEGSTAGDYFGGIIGKRNFQRVLGPALDAVICQPAQDFPADALFRKKPRRKDVIRSFTGPQGLQSLLDAIVRQPGLEARAESSVERIEATEVGYRVFVSGKSPVETNHLALAVAPDTAARLLQPVLPQLVESLCDIEMAEVESLAVLLEADSIELPRLAGIIGRNDDFYSVVSRDLVTDPHYRAFTFHFRPRRLDEAGKLLRIQQVLGVSDSAIQTTADYRNRLPVLRVGHARRIEQVDRVLKGRKLALTGNWFSGVSIEDSLVRSAAECRRLFPG